MKKLIFAIAVVALIASPALAVDWNFYGSARMATWYVSNDLGDGVTVPGGSDEKQNLLWQWQQNSRIGAKVKSENISGQFELGLRADAMTGTAGQSPANFSNGTRVWSADGEVRNRRLYGVWDFGAGKLKVGKDYSPVAQLLFGSVFDDDNGLVDSGAFFSGRPGQIALSFGGFEVAFIEPETVVLQSTGAGFVGGLDTNQVFPKVEAKFGMAMDMFSWNVRGGYQTFHVQGGGNAVTDSFDVQSYVLAADVVVNVGPLAITAAGSYGQNWGNAGWTTPGLYTYGGYATLKGQADDVNDCDSYQFALSGRFKFTDTMTFEVGGGYHRDDPDANGLDEDEVAQYYAQAVIALAPGVWIVPEVGYYNYYDDVNGNDQGDQIYAGLKWQIDF